MQLYLYAWKLVKFSPQSLRNKVVLYWLIDISTLLDESIIIKILTQIHFFVNYNKDLPFEKH